MTHRAATSGRVETAGNPGPDAPVEPPGQPVDPRAVRVSVVGADEREPIVVAPGLPSAPDRMVDDDDPRPTVDGMPIDTVLEVLGRGRALLTQPGSRHQLLLPAPDHRAVGTGSGLERREVVIDGWRIEVEIESAARATLRDRARRGREQGARSGPTEVHAIIPGVVVSVSVAVGDAVTAGQQLLVVEAMKMQNELRAPREGTVERIAVGAGSRIDVGDLLVVLA